MRLSHIVFCATLFAFPIALSEAAGTGVSDERVYSGAYDGAPERQHGSRAKQPAIVVQSIPFGGTSGFAGSGDVTANPAPGRPGAYTQVCTHDYDLAQNRSQWGFARVYVPIIDETQCDRLARGEIVSLNRQFNLVVIAHADGEGDIMDAHLNYEGLAEHLASHAFIVVSINRYATQQVAGAIDFFDDLLSQHLMHLYSGSPVRFSLTTNVALIGHSAGGRSVTTHADIVEEIGLNLSAVVLMAPTVDLNVTPSFNGVAEAFLGLHVFNDTDPAAYGGKTPDQPMSSTFLIYDRAGTTNDIDVLSLTKSMVFANDTGGIPAVGGTAGHFFQNRPFALTYTNAFLQQHLNGHGIFARFLKYQERPGSLPLSLELLQLHQDPVRLTVAAFEGESSQNTHALGGQILYGDGITTAAVQASEVVDPFSPHESGVLFLEMNNNADKRVRFTFPGGANAAGQYALGLRLTRVYLQPDGLTSAPPVDFELCIDGECVPASDMGSLLTFPETVGVPDESLPVGQEPDFTADNGQTKDAMRSYLFRLNHFAGLDTSSIGEVSIDLGEIGAGEAVILDDVAFYPW